MAGPLEVDVPRGPMAPAIARRLVRDRLGPDVARAVLADAEMIVSELVANAVVHGMGSIRVRLDVGDDAVRGEVIDQGPGFEVEARKHGVYEIGGRGLWIVGSLAGRWGVHDGSSHVWFELPLRRAAPVASPPELGEERRPNELD